MESLTYLLVEILVLEVIPKPKALYWLEVMNGVISTRLPCLCITWFIIEMAKQISKYIKRVKDSKLYYQSYRKAKGNAWIKSEDKDYTIWTNEINGKIVRVPKSPNADS